MIDDLSDRRPAIGISGTRSLVFEVLQDASAIFLDSLDVAKESVTLRCKNGRTELTGWGTRCCGGVKGVQHRDAIGLVERFKAHFVDEGLCNARKLGRLNACTGKSSYPTAKTDVHLSVICLCLLCFGLHIKYPFYKLGAIPARCVSDSVQRCHVYP